MKANHPNFAIYFFFNTETSKLSFSPR